MSFLDSVGNALGLGGDSAPPAPPAAPKFYRADWLDTGGGESKGSFAPGGVANALDAGEAIEFIHFGHIHPDWHTNFENKAALSDVDFPDLEHDKGRGVLFRAALLRETILLDGFVDACKTVLADYRGSQGALGDIAGAASSLLGGGSGPPKPKPEDLDKTAGLIRTAGGSVNQDTVKYTDTHKSGVDLTQARADYEAFAGTLGPDNSPGLLPPLPGPAEAVTKILFKLQDVHLKMYLSLREKMEPAIVDACYQISMDAIRQRKTPIYPVWSPKEKPAEAAADEDEDNLLKPVNDAIQDITAEIEERKRQLQEFLGCAESEKAPGDPYLSGIFGKLDSAGEWMIEGFKAVIGDVPGFLGTLTKELAGANVKLLKAACTRLMLRPEEPIDEEMLVEAGREVITRRVLDLLGSIVPGVDMLQSGGPSYGADGLAKVSGKTLGDKLVGWLDDDVTSKIDFIIEVAVSDLADQINHRRSAGDSPVTMEVFLAPLPQWLARMTRDTLFPIWNLLISAVFGNVTGALGGIIGDIGSGLDKVKDGVGDAKKAYDKVNDLKDKPLGFDSGKDMGALQQLATDPAGFAEDQLFGGGGDGEQGGPPPAFPGSPRKSSAKGDEVTKAQVDATQPKWDMAIEEPPATEPPPQESAAAAAA